MTPRGTSIEQVVTLVVLSLLVIGCFVILRPFLAAILWALILAISTWPAYRWLQSKMRGWRTLAATLMTLLLAAVFVLPLAAMGWTMADDVTVLAGHIRQALEHGAPAPPSWVAQIPVFGQGIHDYWQGFSEKGSGWLQDPSRYLGPAKDWLLAVASSVGHAIIQLALSVLITFFIYRDGIAGAVALQAVVERIAGDRTQHLMGVAEGTTKAVVYGIIGTAFVQGLLAGLGLWWSGVPAALLLGVLTAFLSVIPMGPPMVWVPAAGWLLYTGQMAWGVFLALWGLLVVSSVDNFLKPYFISRGSDLPLILVLLGVFGGVLAFGFLGIFIGPTLLAIGFTLLREWGPASSLSVGGQEAADSPSMTHQAVGDGAGNLER